MNNLVVNKNKQLENVRTSDDIFQFNSNLQLESKDMNNFFQHNIGHPIIGGDNDSFDGMSSDDDEEDGLNNYNNIEMNDTVGYNNITKHSIPKKILEQSAKAKNREHAKNTRIRKKNYIESLKESIKFLSEDREKNDRDKKIALTRLAEQV
jgi:hypothetical protein